jgi:hypothetical protein
MWWDNKGYQGKILAALTIAEEKMDAFAGIFTIIMGTSISIGLAALILKILFSNLIGKKR